MLLSIALGISDSAIPSSFKASSSKASVSVFSFKVSFEKHAFFPGTTFFFRCFSLLHLGFRILQFPRVSRRLLPRLPFPYSLLKSPLKSMLSFLGQLSSLDASLYCTWDFGFCNSLEFQGVFFQG